MPLQQGLEKPIEMTQSTLETGQGSVVGWGEVASFPSNSLPHCLDDHVKYNYRM